ncbi:MAG: hypothetical protein ACK6DQ_10315 [Planctomycetota bacterium]
MNCLNGVFVLKPNKNIDLALMRGLVMKKSRLDCHSFEPIITLYVDCVLQNDAPIKQITAFMHSAS